MCKPESIFDNGHEHLCEVGMDALVPTFVGIGQHTARHRAVNASVKAFHLQNVQTGDADFHGMRAAQRPCRKTDHDTRRCEYDDCPDSAC